MQKSKRHHYVPRYYLNGFTESSTSSLLWVYEKGRQQPPRKVAPPVLAVEKHFYSFENELGVKDSDTFEKYLEEEIERPANPVINKIRTGQPITVQDKAILSIYLTVMMKRVPKYRERLQNMAPEVAAEVSRWADRKIPDQGLRREAQRVIEEFEADLPKDFVLQLMTRVKNISAHIRAMTWQFLTTDRGSLFFTSDNPVFFDEAIGLANPISEITVPISKNTALWAS